MAQQRINFRPLSTVSNVVYNRFDVRPRAERITKIRCYFLHLNLSLTQIARLCSLNGPVIKIAEFLIGLEDDPLVKRRVTAVYLNSTQRPQMLGRLRDRVDFLQNKVDSQGNPLNGNCSESTEDEGMCYHNYWFKRPCYDKLYSMRNDPIYYRRLIALQDQERRP